jgi:phosphoribosylanthranilate isomerase
VPNVPRKIVLAGGLDASNVARAIAIAQPWGVDACSKLEWAPGRKDHKRVREFIAAALAVHVS